MQVLKGSGSCRYGRSGGEPFRVAGVEGSFALSTDGNSTRTLKWTDVKHFIKASSISFVVSYTGQVNEVVVDSRHDLTDTRWPPTIDGKIAFPDGVDTYGRTFTVTLEFVKPADGLFGWERQIKQARDAAAVHCAGPVAEQRRPGLPARRQAALDVRGVSERRLALLQGHLRIGLRRGVEQDVRAVAAALESDVETDEVIGKSSKSSKVKVVAPYKRIVVTETAYSTYFAVLVWMQSRHIEFAPLASSFRSSSAAASEEAAAEPAELQSRKSKVKDLMASQNSALPPPASPKSVYRLADYLSLDDLKSLALANLVSQLTPLNVAYELYSDMATYYLPVRDAVLAYAVDHWTEVKDAPATVEMEERGAAGELGPATAGTGMLLARRLAEKLGR